MQGLNHRELSTVLAALRHWQRNAVNGPTVIWGVHEYNIACDDGHVRPLSADEIDALCERINVAGDVATDCQAPASHRKPLVYVTVDGGVAEVEVEEPGSALVLLYDFDNASVDAGYPDEPLTWPERRARAEAIEAERIASQAEG